jgi:hypothetical protein
LTEAEVQKQVDGVWKLLQAGRCIAPGSKVAAIGQEAVKLYEYPPALALWVFLKQEHSSQHEFCVSPEGLTNRLPYSENTIAKARDYLLSVELLAQTHKGVGKGNPSRFRFNSNTLNI